MKLTVKNMVERTNKFILIIAGFAIFMMIVFQYVCHGTNCRISGPRGFLQDEAVDIFPTPDPHYVKKYYFPVLDLERTVDFDIKGEDVIVFLHIQKTGGTTFGRHLVQNVKLEVPCECKPGQKKCTCYRPNRKETWLFSRFSTGWSCGLHADWTELTNCVPGVLNKKETKIRTARKFYYITMLRDPVSRYLSEWRHVQRGATWKTSLHMCDGRTPTPDELPSCYEGNDWSGCTLKQFMDCPFNLANNRQVRMLADLSLVGCYNMSFITERKRAQILLESAKKNLKDMAFFGLTEFQRKTQYLFERTFHLLFIKPFIQFNSTRASGVETDNETFHRIEELNDLDVQLYDYAKDLFQQRFQYKRQLERMERRIHNQEEHHQQKIPEELPKEEMEEQGRVPTEDYMSHIEKW
ncbi:heparan-sulfate 6-O-sulfotransferase 1 [Amblyraja radiata]|uniref:heparan-sulfate 6-O-sulfotransferase 1 n=1 Tax=Amblyraja radiata TaxID=386614 RepID=UPI0014041EB3|nr:heparan-sulfate 6-O-sulfotransferase 1 [Amblyraja radiata]XP_032887297.1 heparan-sulfate 6-O-sulfotransferase 1 [Amblyraja radiata]